MTQSAMSSGALLKLDKNLDSDRKDIIQGLTSSPKKIASKYFYDDRGSELFEKICELPEYYPTRTEASILQQCAAEIAQITGSCELVELGSGSSTKTQFLLDAYQRMSGHCKYVPIDVSGGILGTTVLKLQQKYPTLAIEALIGTYEQALLTLESSLRSSSRMFFFLGSSLGNFSPSECDVFLKQVSRALCPGDYFLLGVDLQKPKKILELAYNDSQGVTANFNLNILSHLNFLFQGNFDLNLFSHQAIYNQQDAQIEMYLHCQQKHNVTLKYLDLTVLFESGEKILTEISRKFDLPTIQAQLSSQGLETIKTWTDPQDWFGLILCRA